MRLLRLELLNLASLDKQGGEVINFEEGKLKNSTIFSIVGETGSGKSTILDAICLALYNRAPRYPKEGQKEAQKIKVYGEKADDEKSRLAPTDPRNILTDGKKDCYSKLTFKANNGNIYRAEWSVHKKNIHYDEAVTKLVQLTTQNGQPVETESVWSELPQIIGLEYDQFLRTVLIAQGSFANFLTAKEDERYELLEKLIGSKDLYINIFDKIKQKKDAVVTAYDNINNQILSYDKDNLTPEELEALENSITELETEEKNDKAELQNVNEALQWFATEENHQRSIERFTNAKDSAAKALEDAKSDINRLILHDLTLNAISLFKDIKEADGNIRKQNISLNNINVDINNKELERKKGEDALKMLQEKADQASKALDEQKPHINKARTIKGEIEAANKSVGEKENTKTECETAYNNSKTDVQKNAEAINRYDTAWKQAQADLKTLKTSIDTEKKRLFDAVQQAASALNDETRKIEGADAVKLQGAESSAERKQHDLERAIVVRIDIAKKRLTLNDNAVLRKRLAERNDTIIKDLASLNNSIEQLAPELDTLRNTHTLMTSENWALHRHNLADGQPCPLCGAIEHPYQRPEALIPVVNDLKNLIEDKEKTLKNQRQSQSELSKEQGETRGKLQSLDDNDKLLNEEINVLTKEWDAINANHPDWSDDADTLEALRPSVDLDLNKASEALKLYNDTVKKINDLRKAKEESDKKHREYEEKANNDLRAAEQNVVNAETQLKTEKGKTENLIAQKNDKEKALQRASEALEEARGIVAQKTAALKAEIGANDPDILEQNLTKAKNDMLQAVSDKNDAMAKLREALEGLRGTFETTQKMIGEEKTKLDNAISALNAWLADYNSKHQQQLTVNNIAAIYEWPDNWESIRQRRDELKTAFTTAQTTLANELTAHDNHQEKKPKDHTKEEFLARKAELENKSHDELTTTKARLQNYHNAKQQIGSLSAQRDAAKALKDEWEAISDAIGSDGKTLRKIAQCYTLRFLVEHANMEIRKFNNRYELQQVNNSLGIRVVDHDRADDVRDITSLSGGETFIVALGLALGLSSLSSKNISFDNLFIDEGFGTLDSNTRAIVINSLAMLQSSQGKKVGIISHTDTLSDSYTTKILVEKKGNTGSSTIRIE